MTDTLKITSSRDKIKAWLEYTQNPQEGIPQCRDAGSELVKFDASGSLYADSVCLCSVYLRRRDGSLERASDLTKVEVGGPNSEFTNQVLFMISGGLDGNKNRASRLARNALANWEDPASETERIETSQKCIEKQIKKNYGAPNEAYFINLFSFVNYDLMLNNSNLYKIMVEDFLGFDNIPYVPDRQDLGYLVGGTLNFYSLQDKMHMPYAQALWFLRVFAEALKYYDGAFKRAKLAYKKSHWERSIRYKLLSVCRGLPMFSNGPVQENASMEELFKRAEEILSACVTVEVLKNS